MRRWLVFFAASIGLGASAGAQVTPSGSSVTGVVVSPTGTPLPYSTVLIVETGAQRFTDEAGAFVIGNLAPGNYHVRVKQLGFTAQDTAIVVGASRQQLRVTLQPSAFKLSTVTVRASKSCISARDAANGGADFQAIIAELRNNAERERLLVKSYPFEYRLARTMDTQNPSNSTLRLYDTLAYRSDTRPPYAPGRLIRDDPDVHVANSRQVMIPVLEDLGDPAFLDSHCFSYKGLGREENSATYRIDFQPVRSLRKPDVEGSVYLDTASFVVRRAVFRLTRPEQFNVSLRDVQFTTNYREIFPGVTVVGDVFSVQLLNGSNVATRTLRLTEKQRLLDFKFIGARPGDATIQR